jgi:hypothetical protein
MNIHRAQMPGMAGIRGTFQVVRRSDTEAEQMRSALKSTKPASASAASHDDEVLPVSVDTDASASAGASDGTDDEVLPAAPRAATNLSSMRASSSPRAHRFILTNQG